MEVALRLAGSGYPTSFTLPSANHGQATWVQNNQFGWRFFGRQMARSPYPFSIARQKAPGTIRIFVFGESAAYGDPQPAFGLPRVLQTLLSQRHPDLKFEVVNAAMTGINSHTLLPIARDCAQAGGDIWVVYMGNNEVVGPFGAGTVFGPQAPPLPLIRASLAMKATRTGQMLDSIRDRLQPPPSDKSEWGGMMMFLNQQVRADDARMNGVYRNFERNLSDILQAGHKSGAGVVVSTVAVNLRDCAPFGSGNRNGLGDSDKSKWEQLYAAGNESWKAGNLAEALAQYEAAARIDETHAGLQFQLARCALAQGRLPEAERHFLAARDQDTLRFRCDTRLNELIRRTASGREADRVLLADSERAFAQASTNGLPGSELFYEHVHLTFDGNYLLARTLAGQVERLLPAQHSNSAQPWASPAECARRLARTDRDLARAAADMIVRLTDPPFTLQINHEDQARHFVELARRLGSVNAPATITNALRATESGVAVSPDDPILLEQLATLKQAAGDLPGAEAAIRRSLELLPSSSENWSQLGICCAQQKRYDEAIAAFRAAFQMDPQNVEPLQNLALALTKLNRTDEAQREYRRLLEIKPHFGPAWLALGQLLESAGRKDEADECFRKALTYRVRRAQDMAGLARFCISRGWLDAAATNYADAIKLAPADPALRFESGQNLVQLGRRPEAARRYAEAVHLKPDWAEAHFLLGLELGRMNNPAGAEREFREAVRLMPDLIEARVNLGVALSGLQRYAESLVEFEEVLRRSPANQTALKNAQILREKLGPEASK